MSKLNPGVVTGKDYFELVRRAKEGKYALPAVNVTSSSTVNAALEAAAAVGSDIILQVSNGGANFFGGQSVENADKARTDGAIAMAQMAHIVAKNYGICAVLHTDHANKKLLPWIDTLLDASEEHFAKFGKPLFSSHMLDLSEETLEDNLAISEKYLTRMAKMDMSLEIELGITGGEEDGIGGEYDENADNSHLYTTPEEVLQAYDRLSKIGHLTVAASFGNVHGVYAPGNVKLEPKILQKSQEHVKAERGTEENPVNFVFHGGSGSSQDDIANAVSYGVFKMNIDTDTQFTYSKPIGDYVKANPKAFEFSIDPDTQKPYKSIYDPRKYIREGEKGMVEYLKQAYSNLNGVGKSVAK